MPKQEKKKWFAVKNVTIDGKIYNAGEIVFTNDTIIGLEELKEEEQLAIKTYNGAYISKEPVISVMITFHNKEKYCKKCIESFLNQSVRIPYEIIAVDDASTDKTEEILKSFGDKINYYKVDFKSAAKARNFGLTKMKGKYWTFFDGDDFCYPTYLETLFNGIQGFDVCATRYKYDVAENNFIIPSCNFFEYDEKTLTYCGMLNTPIMVVRELAENLHWDENLFSYEDWNISLQLKEMKAKVNLIKERHWEYVSNPDSKWGSGQVRNNRLNDYNRIIKRYKSKIKKADVTFFSLISQDRTLDLYFDGIEKIDMPREKMHYIVIIDSKNEKILEYVKNRVKDYKFLTTKIYFTNEQDKYEETNFRTRAERITRNLKYALNEADKFNNRTPYIFMIEDDTLVPKNAFKKLWAMIKKDEKIAYVSGIETSKCGDRHLGCCYLHTDESGDITHRVLPKPKKTGVESFDGGGWYCWIGRVDIIKKMSYNIIDDGRYLGPDTLMVYELKQKGYKALFDWSIACQHYDYIRKKWIKVSDGVGWELQYVKTTRGDKPYRAIVKKL